MRNLIIDNCVQRLIESGLATAQSMAGCSEEQIHAVEAEFGITLPETYRLFLRFAGQSAGQFLIGSDFLFPRLLELRNFAQVLVERKERNFRLAPTDFVFLVHQGYQFLFFNTQDLIDDPAVYHFLDSYSEPRKIADRFSEWLLQCINDEIDAYQALDSGRESGHR